MTRKENQKMLRRRLANAYLSSVVSISLVLLLIGVASLLVVNAGNVSDYFKENLQLSVILKQSTTDSRAEACLKKVTGFAGVRQARVVSREEGTEELKQMLGEDFLTVFETSPVPLSIELSLSAAYVCSDSISVLTSRLSALPEVEEVSCQQSLVEALSANLARISLVLGVFIVLLLFISFVLINNTVRLNVFSRRFTVHTMKLVGATRAFIRRPFLIKSIWQGLLSSAIAILMLSVLVMVVRRSFPTLFDVFSLNSYALTCAIVLSGGVVICLVSTYFVVNKLVSLDKDDLYY